MGRIRLGTVHETPRELRELREANQASPWVARLLMLERIRSNPAVLEIDLAREFDVSERTIRRWWSRYQQHGLGGLVSRFDPERELPRPQILIPRDTNDSAISRKVIGFLNGLPSTGDLQEWIEQARSRLQDILDVDRVTLAINIHLDLDRPAAVGRNRPGPKGKRDTVEISQRGNRKGGGISVAAERSAASHLDRVLNRARSGEFPVEEYSKPYGIQIDRPGVGTVGSILLWRRRERGEIPKSTIDLLEELHPFLSFLLTDCIARRPRNRFDVGTFTSIIMRMADTVGLTRREIEILIPHMLGKSIEEIAVNLNVAPRTVKSHIGKINGKTGCRTASELFARFLTPVGASGDQEAG